MGLLDLPAELVQSICALCTSSDIQNLRLTCRSINNLASDLLYSKVEAVLCRPSLDHLLSFASFSPAVRRGATSLFFHLDALEEFSTEQEWDELRRRSWTKRNFGLNARLKSKENQKFDYPEPLSDERRQSIRAFNDANKNFNHLDRESRMRYFTRCKQNLEDQRRLLDQDRLVYRNVAAILQACPNMTELELWTGESSIKGVHAAVHHRHFREGFYTALGAKEGSRAALLQILQAAHDISRPITRLDIGFVDHQILIDPQSSAPFPGILKVMSDLKALNWNFGRPECIIKSSPVDREDHDRWTVMLPSTARGELQQLLRPTRKLTELCLRWFFPPPRILRDARPDLDHIVGDLHWPCLRELTLRCFRTTAERLTSFLSRHKETLERIELRDVVFIRGEWEECLRQLRPLFPNIKEVHPGVVFYGSDKERILRFY